MVSLTIEINLSTGPATLNLGNRCTIFQVADLTFSSIKISFQLVGSGCPSSQSMANCTPVGSSGVSGAVSTSAIVVGTVSKVVQPTPAQSSTKSDAPAFGTHMPLATLALLFMMLVVQLL